MLLSLVAVVPTEPIMTWHALACRSEEELGTLIPFAGGWRRGGAARPPPLRPRQLCTCVLEGFIGLHDGVRRPWWPLSSVVLTVVVLGERQRRKDA